MSPSIPVVLERDNVNDESVVLVRWFARHGDRVEANGLLAEVETSKANVEVFSPQAGFLVWSFPEGADVPVSAPIGHISELAPDGAPQFAAASNSDTGFSPPQEEPSSRDEDRPALSAGSSAATSTSGPEFPPSTPYRQRFSPLAAKMMEAHGLTAADFSGRSVVRKQDVLDCLEPPAPVQRPALQPRGTGSAKQGAATATRLPGAAAKITQPYREIALSRMKLREGSSLAAGVGNAIQSAVSVTCMTQGLRRSLSGRTAGASASAVILYEVSRLLRKYPALNATYRDGTMLQYQQVNLGFAMDDGRALKVVVFPECDTLSLQQISSQLSDLTVAYVEDKLTPAQIANATFTISDLSGMGVSSFYPLISENQGGILGVGAEQFVPGSAFGWFNLTLAFDHQLSDGRTAALFLNDLKSRLLGYESPLQEARQDLSCSQCGRSLQQLTQLDANLLLSALPKGYVCTLCMVGY